jgi:hypothetical protein
MAAFMMKARAVAILGFLVLAAIVEATDVPVEASLIRLSELSGRAGRRTYVALQDGQDPMPIPDPRITGAKAFIGPVGSDPVVELDFPASGWSGSARNGYKFKSRETTVVTARLESGRMRFSARGDGAYPLDGTPQGALGVIVEIGDVRYCGFFGGTITKDDGTRFIARRASAPQACPELGTTTTTTTSTSSTTSTSTTTTTSTTIPPDCGLWEPNVLPSGSYGSTCVCDVAGCLLSCRCAFPPFGRSTCVFSPTICPASALDLSTCGSGDIGNNNGNLTCAPLTTTTTLPPDCGLYHSGVLPSGSYAGSCVSCAMSGCSLDCVCRKAGAPMGACPGGTLFCVSTSLDVSTCGAGDIGNFNGNLGCPGL